MQTISLNEIFVKLVSESPIMVLVTPPTLALTVFRLEPTLPNGLPTQAELNVLNEQFFRRISARTEIYLTQTVLNGTFCIRFAVGAERSEEQHVLRAFEILKTEGQLAIEAWGGKDQ